MSTTNKIQRKERMIYFVTVLTFKQKHDERQLLGLCCHRSTVWGYRDATALIMISTHYDSVRDNDLVLLEQYIWRYSCIIVFTSDDNFYFLPTTYCDDII